MNKPTTIKNTLLALLGFVLLSTPLTASAQFQSGDFTYDYNDTGITITDYTGPGGVVVIPPTIAGLPVTAIYNYAFEFNTDLTGVTIPAGVTSIDEYAFLFCSNLIAINVDAANTFYTSLDGVLFNKSQTTLILFPPGKAGSYIIPGTVTSIQFEAFEYCTNLTSVTIPDNVTRIGDSAFGNCTSLTSITIPGSVTNIGNYVFFHCISLTNVTIPKGVNGIGDYVFKYCDTLRAVKIPSSVISLGYLAFYRCTNLISINVDSANTIYSSLDGVLLNREQTTLIQFPPRKAGAYVIPGSVTNIMDFAFGSCGLTNITFPGSVTFIGNGAFEYCTGLSSVTIPNGVISIGYAAFSQCTGMTSIAIPRSVTAFGHSAFANCMSLMAITVDAANATFSSLDGVLFNKSRTTLLEYPGGKAGSYSIPGNVTNIGEFAFEYCNSLTSVTIPASVISIGDYAFQSCTRLTSVTMPGGVTFIRHRAFARCTGLTNVTIPSSVTGIGDDTFYFCTSLRGLYFKGNAPSAGVSAFDGATNVTVYYLPGTTGWGTTFNGRPTKLWNPRIQTSGPRFGVGPAGFRFNITGTANIPIVVEACTNLANASWVQLQSLNLTNGLFYFSDPNWGNYPARNYRIRSP